MSGDGLLLDSVILIDHFNGIEEGTSFLSREIDRVCISAITRAEVLTGFDAEAAAVAAALLDRFRFFPIGLQTADLAARLRRERRWKLPDALQAAVALQHGLKLVTRNTRDFDPQRDRFVMVPYTFRASD